MEQRRTDKRATDALYVRELGKVLRKRDISALREFLARSANERGDPGEAAEIEGIPDADLEARMHKMIVARRDLPDLYQESCDWLIAHGITPLRLS